jgi:hypothetical protein
MDDFTTGRDALFRFILRHPIEIHEQNLYITRMGASSTMVADRIAHGSPLELRPYSGNARTHSRKQIKAIAAIGTANAANIQVTGKAAGLPVVAAVNTGALTAASA